LFRLALTTTIECGYTIAPPMKRLTASVLITCVAGVVVAAQDSKVQRGQYLVEEVARCQECHTPRTDTNDFDRAKWMKGATLVSAFDAD